MLYWRKEENRMRLHSGSGSGVQTEQSRWAWCRGNAQNRTAAALHPDWQEEALLWAPVTLLTIWGVFWKTRLVERVCGVKADRCPNSGGELCLPSEGKGGGQTQFGTSCSAASSLTESSSCSRSSSSCRKGTHCSCEGFRKCNKCQLQ